MITIGVDAHKDTHTLVALGATGTQLGTVTVAARTHGHHEAIAWAAALAVEHDQTEVVFAIEDCRHVTGLLEHDLLEACQDAVRVPTVMATRSRRSGRRPGKSDPIDAHAIARAAQSEDHLPPVQRHRDSEQIAVLREIARAREGLVGDRVRQTNRIYGDLHRLDPEHQPGDLRTLRHARDLATWLQQARPERRDLQVLRELLIDAVDALLALTGRINALSSQIRHHDLVKTSVLRQITGCGAMITADLISTIGDITHYRTADAFASAGGMVPIPVASGRSQSMRVNTGGNRRLNHCFWQIADYQIKHEGTLGHDLYQRCRARGKTHRSAHRIVRCHIAKYTHKLLTRTALLT